MNEIGAGSWGGLFSYIEVKCRSFGIEDRSVVTALTSNCYNSTSLPSSWTGRQSSLSVRSSRSLGNVDGNSDVEEKVVSRVVEFGTGGGYY
jgi:hypothetical protein